MPFKYRYGRRRHFRRGPLRARRYHRFRTRAKGKLYGRRPQVVRYKPQRRYVKPKQLLEWKNTRIKFESSHTDVASNHVTYLLNTISPDDTTNYKYAGTSTVTTQSDFDSHTTAVTGVNKIYVKHIVIKGDCEINAAFCPEALVRIVVAQRKFNKQGTWNTNVDDFMNYRDFRIRAVKFLKLQQLSTASPAWKRFTMKIPVNAWFYTDSGLPATDSSDWTPFDERSKLKMHIDTNVASGSSGSAVDVHMFYKIVFGIPPNP